MSTTVLITGATGKVGGYATKALLSDKSVSIRALVRNRDTAQWIADAGGELVTGDLDDSDTVNRALTGIHTLALITPGTGHAAKQAAAIINLAQQAGVQKVVRLSAIKASLDGPTDNTRQHAMTERAIRDSGMRHVFLRPNYFMQNLIGSLDSILGEGKVYAGMNDSAIALVDTRDVGAALAAAVLTDRFDGSALEISGPQSITHDTVANEISKALGRNVKYIAVTPAAAGEALRAYGLDDWTIKVVADYSAAYARGFGDFVTDSMQQLTGRAPRDFGAFAREVLAPLAQATPARRSA